METHKKPLFVYFAEKGPNTQPPLFKKELRFWTLIDRALLFDY